MVKAHPMVGHGLRAIVVIGVIGAAIMHTIPQRPLAIIYTGNLLKKKPAFGGPFS
jgi:hypothetical protein